MTGFTKGGRSEDEWRQLLDGDRCRVLFQEGTEPPFSSQLNGEKRAGTFICAACHQPNGQGLPGMHVVGLPETECDCRADVTEDRIGDAEARRGKRAR